MSPFGVKQIKRGQDLNIEACNSMPKISVKRAILNGFQDVRRADFLASGEIGNRPGDLENAIISSRA